MQRARYRRSLPAGLDPCMRLSTLAAQVIADYLKTGDAEMLQAYSGELFRARFASRLWMRRLVATARQPALLAPLGGLRPPLFHPFSWVFFFAGPPSLLDVQGPPTFLKKKKKNFKKKKKTKPFSPTPPSPPPPQPNQQNP